MMICRLGIGICLGLASVLAQAQVQHFSRAQVDAAARRALPTGAPAATAAQQLQSAQALATGDALAGERELHRLLLDLRGETAPTPALRAQVEQLRSYTSIALTTPPDPDHGRGRWVPAYNVAAAAGGTLAVWDSGARRDDYRAQLAAGRHDFLREAAAHPADLVPVLQQADPALLSALRASAAADTLAPAVAVMAAKLADATLARRLLTLGDDTATLQAMDALAAVLAPAESLSWLQAASRRPALASAAALKIGGLHAPRSAAARQWLFEHLGDPTLGGSCAQALARLPPAQTQAMLQATLDTGRDDLPLRRTLLALQLMRSREAQAQLLAFSSDTRYDAALRGEVAAWLR